MNQNIKYASHNTKYADQNTKCAIPIENTKYTDQNTNIKVIYAILWQGNFCLEIQVEFTHFFGEQFSNALEYKKW